MAERKRLSESDQSSKESSKKRKLIQTTLPLATTTRPPCKYGAKCYRKHPDHLRAYFHPSTETKEAETEVNGSESGATATESEGADAEAEGGEAEAGEEGGEGGEESWRGGS